jgi:hypothetical protein
MPSATGSIFHELELMGITPVIAHPERNGLFNGDPTRLEDLVDRGALVQITAGSLLGDFGYGPLEACEEFFRRGLVHFVASDAHSLERRPPRLAAARERVRREWGLEAEAALFETNPEALLRSEAIAWPRRRKRAVRKASSLLSTSPPPRCSSFSSGLAPCCSSRTATRAGPPSCSCGASTWTVARRTRLAMSFRSPPATSRLRRR